MAVNVNSDKISLMLSVGEAFVSASGKKFVAGEIYTLPKEEAMSLLGVKGPYDMRFFKKHAGEVGVEAAPEDLATKAVLPTVAEVAESMVEASQEREDAALALDKADAIASATRGVGDPVLEAQVDATKAAIDETNNQGETDTAGRAPRGRGAKAVAV